MKKKLALVTGGYSGEAEISYKSAATISNNLDTDRFDVFQIDVRPDGWFYTSKSGQKSEVDRADFSIHDNGAKVNFDVVFVGMHGTPGEDGKLLGYFDMLGLPYTCCDATTSALTFNKRYTVAVAAMAGIPVAPSAHLFKNSEVDITEILKVLKLPYFVKPNNGGSSIGMSKVNKAEELQAALDKAFREDDQVLVEQMITGREFTVGVFKSGNEIQVLPITEIVSHKEFFDFEAKYQGHSTETTPAAIPETWKTKLEQTSKKIYQVFNCRGVVRIDFIYSDQDDCPFVLEINTIPGQTDASVIPQQVRAKGWSLKEFYTGIVEQALNNK